MITNLNELAKYLEVENFELDLELLDNLEGRRQLNRQIAPLGVGHLDIIQKLADIESDEILRRQLQGQAQCLIRIYCVSGYDFASRDAGGFSDTYLFIKCGTRHLDERKHYQMNEPNPVFNKYFEIESTFPGCPMLEIRGMDHDFLFGDELIGNTVIDLEDRYFLPEWNSIKDKPVEYRSLHHPSS